MTTSRDYVLSNTWEHERERLDALSVPFDPMSLQLCLEAGLRPGASVLEVGPGTGRFGQLMADAGATVVGVDIEPALALSLPGRTYDVVQGDVRDGTLPDGPFDLVHARLVVGHLPDRRGALRTLADRLAPGGWLVVEDFDRVTSGTVEPPDEAYSRVADAIWQVLAGGGFDGTMGRQLQGALGGIGLSDVVSTGDVQCAPGDPERGIPQWDLLLDQLLVPVQARVPDEDIQRFRSVLRDPAHVVLSPMLVRARGRRR